MKVAGVVLLALSCAAVHAAAGDRWVAPGGSDANDGLTPATAWATLGHAAAVVVPGDTVRVADGDYQGFYLERSGTPGSPVTFRAEGPDVRIVADNGRTPDGINVENAAHVVIEGFVVDGRTRAGIRVALAQDVRVRGCHTGANGRWGIFTGFADDLVIEDNEAWGSIAEHGIYVSNSGDRPVIRRNHVYANRGNGIHMNGDASQGGDGVISDALVEANVVHGNGVGGGSGINMDGVVGSVVRNNLLYDNHASGVSLYRIDGGSGSRDNLVTHNTIVNAADGRWCVNVNTGSTGNVVVNNVLWNLHPFRGVITVDASSLAGFVSDHNAVMDRFSDDGGDTVIGLTAWRALGFDVHSFVAAPAANFLAPGTDFHLLPTSPAVDAAGPLGAVSSDLDGNPRPVGAAADLGAYERQLVECGDGGVDPGEQCGEPGLACADPCTTCAGCVCVTPPPVCGDGLVCAAEECEDDADCGSGRTCSGCRCETPPVCASGIALERPVQKLVAARGSLKLRAEAVVPLPWSGVDPLQNGIRIVVDSRAGQGGFDVTLPGGAVVAGVGWSVNAAGTRWRFTDPAGAHAGIRRAILQDRSSATPGRLRLVVKGSGGVFTLPAADDARTQVVFGAADECAALVWGPPAGPPPRCDGDASRLSCR